MEERYPLPPFVRRYAVPPEPPAQPWFADRTLLFGGEIQTRILLTIGAIGWTFEAVCCGVCIGSYRRVVKTALRRLEEQGVLEADRPHGHERTGPHHIGGVSGARRTRRTVARRRRGMAGFRRSHPRRDESIYTQDASASAAAGSVASTCPANPTTKAHLKGDGLVCRAKGIKSARAA